MTETETAPAWAQVLGPLETGRLVLRASVPDDASVFHQLWTERDARVPAHRRLDARGRPSVGDIGARLASADPLAAGPRLLTVALRSTGAVIGYCGLNPYGDGPPSDAELAYELTREAQGHGYATEAAEAVVAWAGQAGYRRLWAGVWDWNRASRRVLDKVGFTEVRRGEPRSVHGQTIMTARDL